MSRKKQVLRRRKQGHRAILYLFSVSVSPVDVAISSAHIISCVTVIIRSMESITGAASFFAGAFIVVAPSAVYIPQMQALMKVCGMRHFAACPHLLHLNHIPPPSPPLPHPLPHQLLSTPQSQDLYRTSGFSIGIPITLLVSTILKLHFWFGSMFSLVLLAQCLLLACVQAIMLFLCFSKAPPRGIILASAA